MPRKIKKHSGELEKEEEKLRSAIDDIHRRV